MIYHVGYVPYQHMKKKKFKVKSSHPTKPEARVAMKALYAKIEKFGGMIGTDYEIKSDAEVKAQWAECDEKTKQKRAVAVEKRKASGKTPTFILCPRCQAKSKKLHSEMGGLQTRVCQNGHEFAYDTFGGTGRYTQTYNQFCNSAKPGF